MNQERKNIRAQERISPPACLRQADGGARTLMACALVVYVLMGCVAIFGTAASEEPRESALGIVIDVLKGDDEAMRAVAIAMVKEMPGTEITKALAKELPNLSVTSQVQLLSALSDRGDPAALPAVVAATQVKDKSVRVAALKALGQLGDASSVVLLAQAAATASDNEKKTARESLYQLRGSNVDETILEAIPKSDAGTKIELIRSIAERNIYAGVKTLLKTAQDSDSKVRLESLKVLSRIADQQYLPALVELLINMRTEDERNEAVKTVAAVAHKIGEERRAEAVLKALPSVNETKSRCALLRVLGKIGDDSSVEPLRAALKDEDVKVRDAAIRALSEWPSPTPIADVLAVARSSDNKTHRILALRGFIRLLGLDSVRPAKETIKMYREAMSLAEDAALKTRVLSGLANVKSFAALAMAAEYLEDPSLQQEAEFAVVKIAEQTRGSCPQETKVLLQKVIQKTKNDSLRQQAQEVVNQIERFEDYLTAWQVSGPYTEEGTDGSGLFDVVFAPEKSEAEGVTWQIMPAGTNQDRPWLMELDNMLGGDDRVAYLRNKVWSEKEQKVRLELGSNDGIKVWLNGELVHSNNVTRPVNLGDDKIDVTLRQGWNELLLKVTQLSGQWAVCARFRQSDSNRVDGLKIQVEEP